LRRLGFDAHLAADEALELRHVVALRMIVGGDPQQHVAVAATQGDSGAGVDAGVVQAEASNIEDEVPRRRLDLDMPRVRMI
jgi:hypothetical protein